MCVCVGVESVSQKLDLYNKSSLHTLIITPQKIVNLANTCIKFMSSSFTTSSTKITNFRDNLISLAAKINKNRTTN